MKILGKKQHPILGEIDDVQIEESDFDFTKEFEDLDINKKADFLSFIGCGMLPRERSHPVYKMVLDKWYSMQLKTAVKIMKNETEK